MTLLTLESNLAHIVCTTLFCNWICFSDLLFGVRSSLRYSSFRGGEKAATSSSHVTGEQLCDGKLLATSHHRFVSATSFEPWYPGIMLLSFVAALVAVCVTLAEFRRMTFFSRVNQDLVETPATTLKNSEGIVGKGRCCRLVCDLESLRSENTIGGTKLCQNVHRTTAPATLQLRFQMQLRLGCCWISSRERFKSDRYLYPFFATSAFYLFIWNLNATRIVFYFVFSDTFSATAYYNTLLLLRQSLQQPAFP